MSNCFHCGKEIFFHDSWISRTGKKIPLTKTGSRYHKHRCSANPFNKNTRRAWWRQQNRNAEEQRERNRREYEEQYRQNKWTEETRKVVTNKFEKACSILGVAVTATEQEIKNAYRALMLRYHPDRCHEPDAGEKTKMIIWAYENSLQ